MSLSRSRAAELGRRAVEAIQRGYYVNRRGEEVSIAEPLRQAVEGTRSYPPEAKLAPFPPANRATRITVVNESTLEAAHRLVEEGYRPAALNFASAKHPGGGFLNGARAQEESLARSSGLYACLQGNAMYAAHRALGDAMYLNYAIYSPDVPVFCNDEGQPLDAPFLCSFITSPAVNAKVVLERNPLLQHLFGAEIREAMQERIDKVLHIAALHEHAAIVLGAWGCGVFGNDSREIARLFATALSGPFAGVFERVVFAVLDWTNDRHFIGPFEDVFSGS